MDNLDDNDIALSGKAQLIYLLRNSNIAQQIEYGYLVNDGAVLENIAQSINSYFTFIIKNAKIKIV